MVGRTTLSTCSHGRPATSLSSRKVISSGTVTAFASGIAPGQIGNCWWPSAGCHAAACAFIQANAATKPSMYLKGCFFKKSGQQLINSGQYLANCAANTLHVFLLHAAV